LEKVCETYCRAFSQLAKQIAIIEEIPTDNLGDDAEDVLPVRYGVQYVVLKMGSELNYFLRMARVKVSEERDSGNHLPRQLNARRYS